MNPDRYHPATLAERVDFTGDLACFRFRLGEALPFVPGQYATLALEGQNGKPIQRAYSIVSAPHEPTLEFFIEFVEAGALTPLLWDLKPGDDVWVRKKVVGQFVLAEGRRCHAMAATVTGAAPFVSMARAQRHALEEGTLTEPHRFLLIHGASRSEELGRYLDELRAFDESDWLTYVPTVSRPWEDAAWTGETGRVEDVLRKHLDRLGFDAGNAVGYACGNPQMIENAKGILARCRFAEEHVLEEKYFTTPASEAEKAAEKPHVESPPKGPPLPAAKLPPSKRPPSKRPPQRIPGAVKPPMRGKLPPSSG